MREEVGIDENGNGKHPIQVLFAVSFIDLTVLLHSTEMERNYVAGEKEIETE